MYHLRPTVKRHVLHAVHFLSWIGATVLATVVWAAEETKPDCIPCLIKKAEAREASFEYYGRIATPRGTFYCLRNITLNASVWVRPGEGHPEWKVRVTSANDATGTLTIEVRGQSITLRQKEAPVQSSGERKLPAAERLPSAFWYPPIGGNVEAVATEVDKRRAAWAEPAGTGK